MKKTIEYKTRGTCSRQVCVTVEDGIITSCNFLGGCSGNTQGVASLVVKGIKCGFKDTSCPDQLALALEKMNDNKGE